MTENPSKRHDRANDLFAWPRGDEAWEPHRLSEEQMTFFHGHGPDVAFARPFTHTY